MGIHKTLHYYSYHRDENAYPLPNNKKSDKRHFHTPYHFSTFQVERKLLLIYHKIKSKQKCFQ